MTHDLLCLAADGEPCIQHGTPSCPCDCQCTLIAKVRADCLEKAKDAYIVGTDNKVLNPNHPEYSHDGTEIWNSAINTAIAYMTGAIE